MNHLIKNGLLRQSKQRPFTSIIRRASVHDDSKVILPSDAVGLLGVPSDANSSFLRGTADAPLLIRQALYSSASNLWTESGAFDLSNHWIDYGDLKLGHDGGDECFTQITDSVNALLAQNATRLLFIGGDHSITYPIMAAYAHHYYKEGITILQFDAHPDLYDNFEDNPYSHASPFARIMEHNLAKRLIQVGIRSMTGHQREQAERFNVEVISMDELDAARNVVQKITGPLYVSLDLDGLDPAFAPGVSHAEPGGLSTRQVLDLIHCIRAPLVGADVVEYNPVKDLDEVTAKVAAKLVKELSAVMLSDEKPRE